MVKKTQKKSTESSSSFSKRLGLLEKSIETIGAKLDATTSIEVGKTTSDNAATSTTTTATSHGKTEQTKREILVDSLNANRTAYLLFLQLNYDEVEKETRKRRANKREIMKSVSAKWHALDKELKEAYNEMANANRKRLDIENKLREKKKEERRLLKKMKKQKTLMKKLQKKEKHHLRSRRR